MGTDALVQPGNMQEIMLHETAVAWLRVRLAENVPARPWLETRADYTKRLKACCETVNKDLDVEGLCRAFLRRIEDLRVRQGGRLSE